MNIVQPTGIYERQFREIVNHAIDRREFVDVTTAAADTEFSITHSLRRVPIGYLIISQNKAGSVYLSGAAGTTEKIFLKASAATMQLRVMVF